MTQSDRKPDRKSIRRLAGDPPKRPGRRPDEKWKPIGRRYARPEIRKTQEWCRQQPPYFWGALIVAAVALVLLAVVLCTSSRPEPRMDEIIETLPPPESNPYGPEDFVYAGDYLTCTAADSTLGVDVSEHQGEIDWNQVRDAGVEYAMIRLGYRGNTEGGLFEDPMAEQNLQGARDAGLKVGAYFYSQATTPAEAREEAEYSLKILDGMKLDYPLAFDWEYVDEEARTGDMDPITLTESTIAFCEEVEQAGYEPMVYFNQDLGGRMFLLEELTDYGFWLAMYTDEMNYPYRVDLWQYTQEGTVPGIPEPADINLQLP